MPQLNNSTIEYKLRLQVYFWLINSQDNSKSKIATFQNWQMNTTNERQLAQWLFRL